MRTGERGIVTGDLGPLGSIGMRQEEQIVDGHDLRGAASRDEERVRRMHDVAAPRKRLDRWPSDPVPQKVQHANRNAAIDDASLEARGGVRRRAVAP
jgi:hypothetical protein